MFEGKEKRSTSKIEAPGETLGCLERCFCQNKSVHKLKKVMEVLQHTEKIEAVAFLADITSHFNEWNLKLQGRTSSVCGLVPAVCPEETGGPPCRLVNIFYHTLALHSTEHIVDHWCF